MDEETMLLVLGGSKGKGKGKGKVFPLPAWCGPEGG